MLVHSSVASDFRQQNASLGGAHDRRAAWKLNEYLPPSNFALMNLYYFNIRKKDVTQRSGSVSCPLRFKDT